MQNHFFYLTCIFILFFLKIKAQQNIPQHTCFDAYINKEVDSIKQQLSTQGFVLLKENSMQMESEYEIPVIMPLTEGSWYQFIFIGDITSRLYEVRMFDWNEKQVVYQKKMWGDVDGNIISFSYIPKFSEYHMMRSVQVNKKKKNLCGYVMAFKKIK